MSSVHITHERLRSLTPIIPNEQHFVFGAKDRRVNHCRIITRPAFPDVGKSEVDITKMDVLFVWAEVHRAVVKALKDTPGQPHYRADL